MAKTTISVTDVIRDFTALGYIQTGKAKGSADRKLVKAARILAEHECDVEKAWGDLRECKVANYLAGVLAASELAKTAEVKEFLTKLADDIHDKLVEDKGEDRTRRLYTDLNHLAEAYISASRIVEHSKGNVSTIYIAAHDIAEAILSQRSSGIYVDLIKSLVSEAADIKEDSLHMFLDTYHSYVCAQGSKTRGNLTREVKSLLTSLKWLLFYHTACNNTASPELTDAVATIVNLALETNGADVNTVLEFAASIANKD